MSELHGYSVSDIALDKYVKARGFYTVATLPAFSSHELGCLAVTYLGPVYRCAYGWCLCGIFTGALPSISGISIYPPGLIALCDASSPGHYQVTGSTPVGGSSYLWSGGTWSYLGAPVPPS